MTFSLATESGARAAIGFRVKTGWAAAALVGGSPDAPRLLLRRHLQLSDPNEPSSRQPYHAGFGLALSDSGQIERLVDGVRRWGESAMNDLLLECRSQAPELDRAGMVVGSNVDPESIPNQHIQAHAREGRLFRTTVEEALGRAALPLSVVLERDLYLKVAETLGKPESYVRRAVTELGRGKSPWRAEDKMAAAVAWLTLAPAPEPSP